MGKTNTIEINGKKYDALTGAVLSSAVEPAPHQEVAAPKPHKTVKRQPAKSAAAHAPKSSHTLMRHAVRKPTANSKHPKAHGVLTKRPLAEVVIKKSARKLDDKRLQEASRVAKSELIKHFVPPTGDSVSQLPAPSSVIKPMSARPVPAAHQPKPAKRSKTTADILEHALQRANSHLQAAPAKSRPSHKKRAAGVGGALVLVALLIGVVFNQDMSNLQLQRASAKVGFEANLPAYQPAGYSLERVSSSQTVVASNFQSNSDQRTYTLVQKRSDWNNTALRDQFVAPRDKNYQVAEAGGHTIYLYEAGSAAWLKDGILYQIQSQGSLSNRQLIELATSL